MQTVKKILPNQFEVINEVGFYRLKNGKIAVDTIDNITINTSVNDVVELVTLEFNKKTVNFWRVNGNTIYALAKNQKIKIPKDSIFGDWYFSEKYPEGEYIKYKFLKSYGIIYFSETYVDIIISHELGYRDICFENGLFYAESEKECEEKYHIIGECSRILGKFSTKCKKVENIMLFYDNNNIYIDSQKYDIPYEINSIEVVKIDNIIFVKVLAKEGIVYYTNKISYLFGPIKKDKIIPINPKACYIHEIIDEKITQICFVAVNKGEYFSDSICCEKGIVKCESNIEKSEFFFTNEKSLYILNIDYGEKFKLLSANFDSDRIFVSTTYKYRRDYNIIGYKNQKPNLYVVYRNEEIDAKYELEVIDTGFEKESYICKYDGNILIIRDGNIIVLADGVKCYKKNICIKKISYGIFSVYVIEDKDGTMCLYDKFGAEL